MMDTAACPRPPRLVLAGLVRPGTVGSACWAASRYWEELDSAGRGRLAMENSNPVASLPSLGLIRMRAPGPGLSVEFRNRFLKS